MKILRKFPYWYLIAVPALVFGLGLVSNQAVLIANHGKFPVMMNDARLAVRCTVTPDDDVDLSTIPAASCLKGGEMLDMTHSIMGPNSHLKPLSDIIIRGRETDSIGDGLLTLGEFSFPFGFAMWLILTIRKLAILVN